MSGRDAGLIRGYLDDMAEPKEDPQHDVHLFL
jgi:hypothetical protein